MDQGVEILLIGLRYGALDEALANALESFRVGVHGDESLSRQVSCAQRLRYALAAQRIQAHEGVQLSAGDEVRRWAVYGSVFVQVKNLAGAL